MARRRSFKEEIEIEIEDAAEAAYAVQTDIARNHFEVNHHIAYNDFKYVTGAPGVGCGEVRPIHEPPAPHETHFGFMHDED